MIPRPNLTRIPGELTKTRQDKYIKDLAKLTKLELLEIKEREDKLLGKKSQMKLLPDKGLRIKNFYEKVLKELANRDEIEEAAKMFSELNIASTGRDKLDKLEWTGKLTAEDNFEETCLDSDDEDETDPIKIIAQSRNLEKKVQYIKPEKLLITEEDLREIESFKEDNEENFTEVIDAEIITFEVPTNDIKQKLEKSSLNASLSSQNESSSSTSSLNLEPYSLYLMDKAVSDYTNVNKFLPYKTTKTNVHDPEKEKLRKINEKHWEITAATPPSMRNSATKMLSLRDSVEIQVDYIEKLKKLHEQQATERLATRARSSNQIESDSIVLPDEQIRRVNKFFGSYRSQDLSSDESDMDQNYSDEGKDE